MHKNYIYQVNTNLRSAGRARVLSSQNILRDKKYYEFKTVTMLCQSFN